MQKIKNVEFLKFVKYRLNGFVDILKNGWHLLVEYLKQILLFPKLNFKFLHKINATISNKIHQIKNKNLINFPPINVTSQYLKN